MIEVTINSKELDKAIARAPAQAKKLIQLSLDQSALQVQNRAKQLAPFMSGNLRRSITKKIHPGVAEVGTNLIYAAIQEFGGVIVPRAKKMLRFKIDGKYVFAKQVKIPPYKGRGYLRPALSESLAKIKSIFTRNFKQLL